MQGNSFPIAGGEVKDPPTSESVWGAFGRIANVGFWGLLGGFGLFVARGAGRRAYKYWTAQSRVAVDDGDIQAHESYSVSRDATDARFPCSALVGTRLESYNSSDGEAKYDLYLDYTAPHSRTDDQEHEVLVAKGLSDHTEAEWIAEQIEEAAARQAQNQ